MNEDISVLGLDTSSIYHTSIGIYFNENENLEIALCGLKSQEEKLLFSIQNGLSILNKKIDEIDCIAVGLGPGSFTGLRIGVSTARALAWSAKKSILGFSSLELTAESLPKELLQADSLIVPLIDARMSKVYSAIFSNGKRVTEDMDIHPEKLREIIEKRTELNVIFAGDGLNKYGGTFQKIAGKNIILLPKISISGLKICASALMKHKEGEVNISFDKIIPVYLRKSHAEAQSH